MIKTLNNNINFFKTLLYISAFFILLLGALSYRSVSDLTKSGELVTHTYRVNVELEQILSYLKDAETGHRGFLVTKDSIFLEPYLNSRERINNNFAELKSLTSDNPTYQSNLKNLNLLISNRLETFKTTLEYENPEDYFDSKKFSDELKKGRKEMDTIRNHINNMISTENQLLEQRKSDYQSNLSATPLLLFTLLLLTLAIMFLAYLKISKNMKKLKEANESLELFKESANQSEIVSKHGNWTWHVESNTFKYSDNLYRLLGEQPQSFEPTLENFMQFVHPEDVDQLAHQVEQMMKNVELPFINYRVVHKNGTIKHLKAYGKSLVNDDDELILLGTTADITDEITSYKALEERNTELERSNKELSSFNHVASHDLQEPLRKIQTFLSRLEDEEAEKLSEKGLKYIDRIQNAATRMRVLIDDLLQFSRSNKADKVFEESNINILLEAAKQDLAEVISEENAIIEADTFPTIRVIPFQIQQLFVNIIGNAIKYKTNNRVPKIKISHQIVDANEDENLKKAKKPYYHKITFEDNGIGFDNQYAEQIFILFSRLHNKDEYSGTGIGLSICKKITDNHKGIIKAVGRPSEGATFLVYLPID
ncbi:CHASE3 domain-containing protein [Olleya sp. YS]|uniref:sensor histidine kinase n=1 Tax=Olleya sp. YS TaxID=3028318 RepID=UPI0024344CEC|nr:CHASE3 domain-containing protein [Olleya sp. YS]WGD35630.1 CHASE3 domain-containing protein [Olleya sp. YS]